MKESVPSSTLNCSWRNRKEPKRIRVHPTPTKRLPAVPQATKRPRSFTGWMVSSLMYLTARSLISSRSRWIELLRTNLRQEGFFTFSSYPCLLYTSDAADDLLCVDLGGRR